MSAGHAHGPEWSYYLGGGEQLPVHNSHHVFGIALASRRSLGEDFFHTLQIFGVQLDIDCSHVFFQIFTPFRTGDWNDVLALRQYPRQCQLRGLAALLACQFLNRMHEVEILLKIVALKSRRVAPVIVRWKIFETPELPGKKTASEGTVGHKPNPLFTACMQDFILGITSPKGILSLQRANRMDFHRPPKCLRARL